MVAGLLLCATLLAPAAPPQDFAAELEEARALAEKGDPAEARSHLRDALKDESQRDAILAVYPAVRRHLSDWAFAERYADLDLEDLFQGEIKSFKPKKRNLRIVYDWAEMSDEERGKDFRKFKDEWFFRVPIADNLKFTIKGEWDHESPSPVSLLVGYQPDERSGWRFTPGYHRTKIKPTVRMPMRCEREGEPFEVLERSSEGLDEPKGDWGYTVELRRGTFTLKDGSKKIGSWSSRYPDLLVGHIGFTVPGLERVEITADLDETAFEARKSETLSKLRDAFAARGYDPLRDLPDWMKALHADSTASTALRAPDDAPPALADAWPELLAGGRAFSIEDFVKKAGIAGEPLERLAWAVHLAGKGDWLEAARLTAECREQGVETGTVLALQAKARYLSGEAFESLRELDEHLEAHPTDVGRARAWVGGRLNGPKAMLKRYDEAIAAGALGGDLVLRRDQIAAVLRGPLGKEDPKRGAAGTVRILSDLGDDTAQDLQDAATEWVILVFRYLSMLRNSVEPLLVLHFAEENAFQAFCKENGIEERLGYHPELRTTFFVADSANGDARRELFRHLWTHMLDTTLDTQTLPQWIVVGGGYYFGSLWEDEPEEGETALVRTTRHGGMLLRAESNEDGLFFRPDQLVKLDNEEFEKHFDWAECESYLLFSFLHRSTDEPYAGKIPEVFKELITGKDPRAVLKEIYAGVDHDRWFDELTNFRQEQIDKYYNEG